MLFVVSPFQEDGYEPAADPDEPWSDGEESDALRLAVERQFAEASAPVTPPACRAADPQPDEEAGRKQLRCQTFNIIDQSACCVQRCPS